jgi:trimethylamine:corrinoid methyltransferase-like protein
MGGRHMVFGNVSSPPNAWDLVRGKRPGDFETFREFMMLTQAFNCIHFAGGYPVEPVDIHPSVRHLDCLFEKLTLTDKVATPTASGPERVEDVMEMVRIAGGLTREEFDAAPRMYTNINSTSPLKHDLRCSTASCGWRGGAAGGGHALHAGGRHGAGDAGGGGGAQPGRGAGGDRPLQWIAPAAPSPCSAPSPRTST